MSLYVPNKRERMLAGVIKKLLEALKEARGEFERVGLELWADDLSEVIEKAEEVELS